MRDSIKYVYVPDGRREDAFDRGLSRRSFEVKTNTS